MDSGLYYRLTMLGFALVVWYYAGRLAGVNTVDGLAVVSNINFFIISIFSFSVFVLISIYTVVLFLRGINEKVEGKK
jgi:hypothetical protein